MYGILRKLFNDSYIYAHIFDIYFLIVTISVALTDLSCSELHRIEESLNLISSEIIENS